MFQRQGRLFPTLPTNVIQSNCMGFVGGLCSLEYAAPLLLLERPATLVTWSMDVCEVHAYSADKFLNHQQQKSNLVIGPPKFRLWFVGDSANDETVKGQEAFLPCREKYGKVFVSGIMRPRTCAHHGRYESILLASFSPIAPKISGPIDICRNFFEVNTGIHEAILSIHEFLLWHPNHRESTITLSGSRKASMRTSSKALHSLTLICCTHRKPVPNVAGVLNLKFCIQRSCDRPRSVHTVHKSQV